jgi:hypothetical protein
VPEKERKILPNNNFPPNRTAYPPNSETGLADLSDGWIDFGLATLRVDIYM